MIQPPKLYLNGFPKSGLHLAVQYVLGMGLRANNPDHNWMGTNPWTVERFNLHTFGKNVIKLQNGEYIKGHSGWLKTIEATFIMLGIGVVFIYRDLRDVVVSQMYHVRAMDDVKRKHPAKNLFRSLNREETMLAIIEGIEEWPGIFDRFDTYAPWLDSEWALSLRYEEMQANPYSTANKLFDYATEVSHKAADMRGIVPHKYRKIAVGHMMKEAQNRKASVTYRKGKRGGWKEEFTPAVVERFKELDPGYTVGLGYEKDNEWQLLTATVH